MMTLHHRLLMITTVLFSALGIAATVFAPEDDGRIVITE